MNIITKKQTFYLITLFVMTLVTLVLFTSNANAYDRALIRSADPTINKQYMRKRFAQFQNKPFDSNNKRKRLLLIGDSQAQDFLNTAMELGRLKYYQIRTRNIPSPCQPFLGHSSHSGVKPKDRQLCNRVDSLKKAKSQLEQADVIIIAALWRDWSVKHLANTIRNLRLSNKQKLIIVGSKSFGRIDLRDYLRLPNYKRRTLRNRIADKYLRYNDAMRNLLKADTFVDQYTLICGRNNNTCPIFTARGELISFDGGHLTRAGANYVGRQIFKSRALSRL